MRIATVLAVAVLVSCSGSEGDGAELDGTWALTRGDGCVVGLVLKEGDYEFDVICELQSGNIGLQSEVGGYSASRTTLTLMPMLSTCAGGGAEPQDIGYELLGSDTLRLRLPGAVAVLKRQPASATTDGPGGAALYGCWADDGAFTRGELQAL